MHFASLTHKQIYSHTNKHTHTHTFAVKMELIKSQRMKLIKIIQRFSGWWTDFNSIQFLIFYSIQYLNIMFQLDLLIMFSVFCFLFSFFISSFLSILSNLEFKLGWVHQIDIKPTDLNVESERLKGNKWTNGFISSIKTIRRR